MNGDQLYLLSEKLMGIAGDASPEGSALREFPPAARLVLADVGQHLSTSPAEIAGRTGLPADFVASAVADLAAAGFLETKFISPNTVRDHLKAIFGKTGVTRRRDLSAALAGGPSAAGGRDETVANIR